MVSIYLNKTYELNDVEAPYIIVQDYLDENEISYPEECDDYEELLQYVEDKEDFSEHCKDLIWEYVMNNLFEDLDVNWES